jgi:hypothetical protein
MGQGAQKRTVEGNDAQVISWNDGKKSYCVAQTRMIGQQQQRPSDRHMLKPGNPHAAGVATAQRLPAPAEAVASYHGVKADHLPRKVSCSGLCYGPPHAAAQVRLPEPPCVEHILYIDLSED